MSCVVQSSRIQHEVTLRHIQSTATDDVLPAMMLTAQSREIDAEGDEMRRENLNPHHVGVYV